MKCIDEFAPLKLIVYVDIIVTIMMSDGVVLVEPPS